MMSSQVAEKPSAMEVTKAKIVEMSLRPTSAMSFHDRFSVMGTDKEEPELRCIVDETFWLAMESFSSGSPIPSDPADILAVIIARIIRHSPNFRRKDDRYARVISNAISLFDDSFVKSTILAMEHRWRTMLECWKNEPAMIASVNAHYARIARGKRPPRISSGFAPRRGFLRAAHARLPPSPPPPFRFTFWPSFAFAFFYERPSHSYRVGM